MAKITRVCLIGPESTGKSRLAERLAQHFGATWIREFAREYAEQRKNQLSYDDVEAIARGHIQIADRGSQIAGLVIYDTDLISTVVYARHYYGRVPEWIVEEATKRRADLYLLLDTNVPWIADSARDTGGESRENVFDAFRAALDESKANWTIISGSWQERFNRASAAISALRSAI
ncbi:MAG TPA: ATP-binding protein [Thermoanaerobaculia bacterium]